MKQTSPKYIGFSDGIFSHIYKTELERYKKENVNALYCHGTNAIEINIRNLKSLNFLINCDKKLYCHFEYISLHLSKFLFAETIDIKKIIKKIKNISIKFNVKNIVIHPDVIKNWNEFELLTKGLPVSIENMDPDKDFGRFPSELKSIINKHKFGITLDLQHCFHNDNTMVLADEFINVFSNKIVEFHVSGYKEKYPHYPLNKTKQLVIPQHIFNKNIPIIIESGNLEKNDIKKELHYIINAIK